MQCSKKCITEASSFRGITITLDIRRLNSSSILTTSITSLKRILNWSPSVSPSLPKLRPPFLNKRQTLTPECTKQLSEVPSKPPKPQASTNQAPFSPQPCSLPREVKKGSASQWYHLGHLRMARLIRHRLKHI